MAPSLSCVTKAESMKRQNPIPDFKKEYREFYRHVFHSIHWLITPQHRFPQGKNLSNNGDTRLPSNRGNNRDNGRPVTTDHLFWPNEGRRATFLLPFSRPNSDFFGGKYSERAKRGGGGVQLGASRRTPRIDKLSRKFCSKRSAPSPYAVALKKTRRNHGDSDQSESLLSRELTANHR